jgi:uncharacterized protein (TIGR00369 family)
MNTERENDGIGNLHDLIGRSGLLHSRELRPLSGCLPVCANERRVAACAKRFDKERASVAPGSARTEMKKMRAQAHSNCVVCSPTNGRSLCLEFTASDDGGVEARFYCDRVFEGYSGILHGGVIASLLDGAMTNCMFAHGTPGVTAELNVRFRQPVIVNSVAKVRAWVERSSPPLHILRAVVLQDKQLRATALGKFMERPALAAGTHPSLVNGTSTGA